MRTYPQQQKRLLYIYHDAIYQVHTSQKWSFLVIYQNIYHMLHRFQYIFILSVYQKKPYKVVYWPFFVAVERNVKGNKTFKVGYWPFLLCIGMIFSIELPISFQRWQHCLLLSFLWESLTVQIGIYLGSKVQVALLVIQRLQKWCSQICMLWHRCLGSGSLGN